MRYLAGKRPRPGYFGWCVEAGGEQVLILVDKGMKLFHETRIQTACLFIMGFPEASDGRFRLPELRTMRRGADLEFRALAGQFRLFLQFVRT